LTEKIVVLSAKEKARQRINVFHGSANHFMNLIKELIGNSNDVFSKDKLNSIKIILHNENKIEYIDSGSGIPIEGTASDGSPNYQAIFEKDFAGSRYGNTETTIGQNGIFLYTLTMTSEDIEYFIARANGNLYNIKYHKGDQSSELKVIGKEDNTYSRIIFSLDREVWNNPKFTFEEICNIAKAQSSLCNVKIIVEGKENNLTNEFYYENGILDYFDDMTQNKSIITDKIRITQTKNVLIDKIVNGESKKIEDVISADLIFSYSNDSNDDFKKEFLNTADLIAYGTIQDGIYVGLKNCINKWLKDNGKYAKNEKQISIDDISTGLNYICNVSSFYVEYDNQIKQKTSVKYYKTVIQEIIEGFMEIYFIENKEESEKLTNAILLNKRIREKSEINRKNIKKELEEKITSQLNRPAKFVPCRSKNPSEIKFTLIEGDSSLNSVKLARNAYDTCILPLKGKPINPFKCKIDALLNNEEIKSIYKILGCGMEYKGKSIKGVPKFNIDNLQVNRVQIATDFDNDGYHIQALLIGIFYTLSPELLKQGKIYILYTPLYVIKTKKQTEYKNEITDTLLVYSEMKRNEIVNKLHDEDISFKETRFKGLGGLPVSIMSKALSENSMIMKQITMDDVEESKKWLELFLSEEKLKDRKEYIETHGDKYFDYSLFE